MRPSLRTFAISSAKYAPKNGGLEVAEILLPVLRSANVFAVQRRVFLLRLGQRLVAERLGVGDRQQLAEPVRRLLGVRVHA